MLSCWLMLSLLASREQQQQSSVQSWRVSSHPSSLNQHCSWLVKWYLVLLLSELVQVLSWLVHVMVLVLPMWD